MISPEQRHEAVEWARADLNASAHVLSISYTELAGAVVALDAALTASDAVVEAAREAFDNKPDRDYWSATRAHEAYRAALATHDALRKET